jgi:hypothetical protein
MHRTKGLLFQLLALAEANQRDVEEIAHELGSRPARLRRDLERILCPAGERRCRYMGIERLFRIARAGGLLLGDFSSARTFGRTANRRRRARRLSFDALAAMVDLNRKTVIKVCAGKGCVEAALLVAEALLIRLGPRAAGAWWIHQIEKILNYFRAGRERAIMRDTEQIDLAFRSLSRNRPRFVTLVNSPSLLGPTSWSSCTRQAPCYSLGVRTLQVQVTGRAVETFQCDEDDVGRTIAGLLLLRGGSEFKGNIYLDGEVAVLGDLDSVWAGMSRELAQTPRGVLLALITQEESSQHAEPQGAADELVKDEAEASSDDIDTMDVEVETEIFLSGSPGSISSNGGHHEDLARASSIANQLLLQANAQSARLVTEASERLFRSLEEAHKRVIEHSIEQSSASMAALREQGIALQDTVSEINLRVAKERVYSAQMAEQEERAKVARARLFALQHATIEHHPEKPGLLATLAQGLIYSFARSQQRKLNK